MESCRGGHGAGGRRPDDRGRAGLRVAPGLAARRRLLVPRTTSPRASRSLDGTPTSAPMWPRAPGGTIWSPVTPGCSREMWPVIERAVGFVLRLQQPGGEVLWSLEPDGTPGRFALLTGSSSIHHSLRCALAVARALGFERPEWELAAGRVAHAVAHDEDAFEPKEPWAMDWYYPVLCGAVAGAAGRARLLERWDVFVMEGLGVRCVSDRPWVTAAETAECAMAMDSVGLSRGGPAAAGLDGPPARRGRRLLDRVCPPGVRAFSRGRAFDLHGGRGPAGRRRSPPPWPGRRPVPGGVPAGGARPAGRRGARSARVSAADRASRDRRRSAPAGNFLGGRGRDQIGRPPARRDAGRDAGAPVGSAGEGDLGHVPSQDALQPFDPLEVADEVLRERGRPAAHPPLGRARRWSAGRRPPRRAAAPRGPRQ